MVMRLEPLFIVGGVTLTWSACAFFRWYYERRDAAATEEEQRQCIVLDI